MNSSPDLAQMAHKNSYRATLIPRFTDKNSGSITLHVLLQCAGIPLRGGPPKSAVLARHGVVF